MADRPDNGFGPVLRKIGRTHETASPMRPIFDLCHRSLQQQGVFSVFIIIEYRHQRISSRFSTEWQIRSSGVLLEYWRMNEGSHDGSGGFAAWRATGR
jgi:hypothetical protein